MKELYETGTEISKGVLKLNSDHYTIVAFYLLTVCIFFVISTGLKIQSESQNKNNKIHAMA